MASGPDPGWNAFPLERLDAWENLWFPIIKASLRHQFPGVHDTVFLNLAQTEGPDVMVTVDTLVRRLRELQADDSETERAALAFLAGRRDAARGAFSETVRCGTLAFGLWDLRAKLRDQRAGLGELRVGLGGAENRFR